MGPYTASSCCCQAPNLPWAPIPPPHAAARLVICHAPLYRLPHAAARSRVCVMGPCTASHCCCLHRHTLCHVPLFRSPHTAGGFFHFCHRVLYGLPLLLPPPPHCGSTLWFWPP
ncbi:unnamed protein product [Staurois parvus]|uniref:Uncharacterized protein n=1 Tax=Staurois parvus TaxID=386267 RepID=A0ABN9C4Q2_9NEOB|nr:unnamed protein product [Staurois parvus]